MIYTDNIYMTADSLEELHAFAKRIGMKRCWYHNPRNKRTGKSKNHPHYDLVNHKNFPLIDWKGNKFMDKAIEAGAMLLTEEELLLKAQALARINRKGQTRKNVITHIV